MDTITPGNPHYNEKSRLAKTISARRQTWGDVPAKESQDEFKLAHANSKMTCYTCHTSWTTSCFGCHLSMTANQQHAHAAQRRPHHAQLHVLQFPSAARRHLHAGRRRHGDQATASRRRGRPARCGQFAERNRDWLYYSSRPSRPKASADGFQHLTTRTPCARRNQRLHRLPRLARQRQQRLDGAASAAGHELRELHGPLRVTSRRAQRASTPSWSPSTTIRRRCSAAICRRSPIPKITKSILRPHNELQEAYHHAGNVLDVQLRGEYLYAAMGKGGFRIFDVANIDNKDFSERWSPRRSRRWASASTCKTKYATAVASPSTLAVDPLRTQHPGERRADDPLMYGFLYVTDKYEGLVVVGDPNLKSKSPGVGTLLDGNPANNFLKRAADLQSGRHSERRAPHHHRRNLRLHFVRSRTGGGGSRRIRWQPKVVAEIGAPDSGGAAGSGRAVPLCVRGRSRGIESAGCHSIWRIPRR